MRVWADSLAGVAGLEWEPVEVKPYGNHVGEYVDEGTVPATSPYKRVLDFRPVRGKLSITISGTPATLIEWGTAPSGTGVVAVDWVGGQLEFAAADAGAAVVATMSEHYGTVIDAGLLMRMGQAIALGTGGGAAAGVYVVGPAGSGAQYQTVQSAIDAIPALGSGEGERSGTWVVRVLPGEYAEAVKVYKSQVVLELLPGSLVVSEDATWAGNMEIVPSFPILVVASDVLVTGGGEAFNPSDTGSSCAVVIGLNAETGEVGEGWEIAPHRVTVARIRARGRHRDTIVVTNSASEDCAINGCYVEGTMT